MLKVKKIAQKINKEGQLTVKRVNENFYWICNNYIIVKMNKKQYHNFKAKWCNYKNNPYIPELEDGETATHSVDIFDHNSPDLDIIIDDANQEIQIKETNLYIKKSKIYYTKNKMFGLDKDYIKNIKGKMYTKDNNKLSQINVYNNNNKLIAIIMPIKLEDDPELTDNINILNSIVGNINQIKKAV